MLLHQIENGISKIMIKYAVSPNGISKIKNTTSLTRISKINFKNYASPSGITLHESFFNESKIISTIRKINKQKVDSKWTGEKKPKVYLHVGPPKHGTTALQCALARLQVSCTPSLPRTEQ
jgi:hypothetical protein